jgi:hypothetical protein
MDLVELEFKDKAILHDTLLLFHANDAINFIRRCHELDRPILGIDSFRLNGEFIQPFLEYSVDYSSTTWLTTHDGSEDIWQEAENFIRKHSELGLVFEIVHD